MAHRARKGKYNQEYNTLDYDVTLCESNKDMPHVKNVISERCSSKYLTPGKFDVSSGYNDVTGDITRPWIRRERIGWLMMAALFSLTHQVASAQSGFCQAFSYNFKKSGALHVSKHMFVCCNNMHEKACEGATYQTPTFTQGM